MKNTTKTKKRSWILRFLDKIEVAGNKLPTPLTIFFYLAVAVVIVSGIGSALGWSAAGEMYNSGSGTVEEATVSIVSLFSVKGLQYMLTSAVTNFTSYAPLGFTIVIMLGIGVAESSGYLNGLILSLIHIYRLISIRRRSFHPSPGKNSALPGMRSTQGTDACLRVTI